MEDAKKKEIGKVPDKTVGKEQDCSISFEFIEIHGEPSLGLKTTEKALFSATGFNKEGSVGNILLAIMNTLLKTEDNLEKKIEKGNQILSTMTELGPRDGFEGLLITLLLLTYDRAMECFKVVENKGSFADMDFGYQNQGIKLMRLYNQQLFALDRHRERGGEG